MVKCYGNYHLVIYYLLLDKETGFIYDYNENSCIKCIEIENWNF